MRQAGEAASISGQPAPTITVSGEPAQQQVLHECLLHVHAVLRLVPHHRLRAVIRVKKGLFPWAASGRAIANGRDEGFTKLLFDDSPEAGSGDGHAGRGHGKILGGGMVGTHAGDMIGEIALAIEMGADAVDIGKTIHPHPTLGESIGMAAEVAHGSCTDVPPARK